MEGYTGLTVACDTEEEVDYLISLWAMIAMENLTDVEVEENDGFVTIRHREHKVEDCNEVSYSDAVNALMLINQNGLKDTEVH